MTFIIQRVTQTLTDTDRARGSHIVSHVTDLKCKK